MKERLYALLYVSAEISPIDGVYVISLVPRTEPPPTHVATG